jgi:transglutaminase-like putative cysteine protease
MTAAADVRTFNESFMDRLRQVPWSPAEGWLTYLLVTVMAMTVAWSIDDAAWVLGNPDYGDFYLQAAILGVLVGFIGAKARWPRWTSHLFGAVIASIVLPVLVGQVLLGEASGSVYDAYRATSTSVVNAWIDLAVLNRQVTPEIGHFILVISIIVWSVAQYASYAVFGHRRPLDGVIVVGIVLLGNMALTINDQLSLLVVFSIAALGVLARTHAFEEQTTWIRRHIGEASTVRSLYLRGGVAFISIAVAGSLALTASASSAPLAGAWTGFSQKLVDVSQAVQRYLPFGGSSRNVGFGFGPSAQITGQWDTNHTLQVTIRVDPSETTHPYWRAIAYDHFDLKTWSQTKPEALEVQTGEQALLDLGDDPQGLGNREEFQYTVTPVGFHGGYVLSPAEPGTFDTQTKVEFVGNGRFASVRVDNTDRVYTGVAQLPVSGNQPGDRNSNALRAAGQNYPSDIKQLYTSVPDGSLGPASLQLLAEIKAKAAGATRGGKVTPFDLAETMQNELQTFKYSTDVRDLPCASISVVECFARFKEGYCQYYASTMAMLLRQEGIPARMVEGFLPGERDRRTGQEQIYTDGAHAWVEVWFPGFGWQAFDPTGGGRAQVVPLPSGPAVVATPSPSAAAASGAIPPGLQRDDDRDRTSTGGTSTRGSANVGLLAAFAVGLLLALIAVVFVLWQRGPRGELTAESAWRSVSRLAARFGFGPRPTQTVYEYAGALGDVLPAVRPELQTVARAKVEVAYGHRQLGADRISSLREAQRRLRVALLRLAFRRRRLRGIRFRRAARS